MTVVIVIGICLCILAWSFGAGMAAALIPDDDLTNIVIVAAFLLWPVIMVMAVVGEVWRRGKALADAVLGQDLKE